jgi:hypothetical protein
MHKLVVSSIKGLVIKGFDSIISTISHYEQIRHFETVQQQEGDDSKLESSELALKK